MNVIHTFSHRIFNKLRHLCHRNWNDKFLTIFTDLHVYKSTKGEGQSQYQRKCIDRNTPNSKKQRNVADFPVTTDINLWHRVTYESYGGFIFDFHDTVALECN